MTPPVVSPASLVDRFVAHFELDREAAAWLRALSVANPELHHAGMRAALAVEG